MKTISERAIEQAQAVLEVNKLLLDAYGDHERVARMEMAYTIVRDCDRKDIPSAIAASELPTATLMGYPLVEVQSIQNAPEFKFAPSRETAAELASRMKLESRGKSCEHVLKTTNEIVGGNPSGKRVSALKMAHDIYSQIEFASSRNGAIEQVTAILQAAGIGVCEDFDTSPEHQEEDQEAPARAVVDSDGYAKAKIHQGQMVWQEAQGAPPKPNVEQGGSPGEGHKETADPVSVIGSRANQLYNALLSIQRALHAGDVEKARTMIVNARAWTAPKKADPAAKLTEEPNGA